MVMARYFVNSNVNHACKTLQKNSWWLCPPIARSVIVKHYCLQHMGAYETSVTHVGRSTWIKWTCRKCEGCTTMTKFKHSALIMASRLFSVC